MITTGNYAEKIGEIGVNNLDPTFRDYHDELKEATSNFTDWTDYNEDAVIKEATDLYFKAVEKLLKPRTERKEETKTKAKEKKRVVESSVKKSSQKKEKKSSNPEVKKVSSIKEEVKFIKRFVGLHNKEKTPNAILNFIKALQRSIVQKLIKKGSPYADEINGIQDRLIKIYNTYGNKKMIPRMELDEKLLTKMMLIAGGEKVYPSIGFIKRFIGMQGKVIENVKRENFISQLERAVKNRKVLEEDPFADKLKKIHSYFKKSKSNKKIELERTELNGLECICKNFPKQLGQIYNTRGKALRRCVSKKYSDSKKGACSHNKGLSGVMTAEQVASMSFELLPFSGTWANLFGKPEKNFTMMIHGEPGAGKSTFLMKFSKYLTGLGNVAYVSSEEFGSVTLTKLVNQYMNPLPKNMIFTSKLDQITLSEFDFVIFDSINDLGLKLEDFKKMKESNPRTALIIVLQNTKDGSFKGGKEWEHEVQIAAEIEDGKISVYKNRYGQKNEWNFFEN